jgi:hypothetical protein
VCSGGAEDTEVPEGLGDVNCRRASMLSDAEVGGTGTTKGDAGGTGCEECEGDDGCWEERDMETCSEPMAPPFASCRALS